MFQGLLGRGAKRVLMLVSCLLLPAVTASAQQPSYFNQASKTAFVDSTSVMNRAFVVNVGSRMILPGTDAPLDFSRGRVEAFVQFTEPLTSARRGDYVLAGVRFDRVYRPNTYLVRLSKKAAALLRADPTFRGIEPVLPVDKLTAGIYRGRVHPGAQLGSGYMAANIRFHENIQLRHALRVLDRWQVLVDDPTRFQYNERLLIYVTHGQALVLAEEQAVRSLAEIPREPTTNNVVAAALSNIDDIQAAPFGLTGDGVRIGIWDGGEVVTTHEQLNGRVTLRENSSLNDHSTHVAGTMIGDGTGNAAAMGMAPGAERLYSYNFNGNTATEQFNCWNNDWIILANHSWGFTLGWDQGADTGGHSLFGYYDDVSEDYDDLVRDTGLIIQKSSGNDGDDCNPGDPNDCDGFPGGDGWAYDTISTHGNAKNIITVGAVDNTPILTGFSSNGPTDDNRIKPDVVAKGDSLLSAWAGGVTLGNCGVMSGATYCAIGGTSMSTPTVTGGLALLIEQYRGIYGNHNPPAEVVKAVVVNSAQDQGRPGPDYAYGHGLFDALAAAEIIQVGPVHILTDEVNNNDEDIYLLEVPGGTPELRVTAAWVDVPGNGNSGNPALVNDIDLEVISPGGTVFYPFSGPTANVTDPATNAAANTVDNVESTVIPNPQVGFWQVKMSGTSVVLGPQDYAIVSNTPFWLPDQPEIEVNANLTFDDHCPGDVPAQKTVTIYNTGGAMLLVHDVEILVGTNFTLAPNPAPPFAILPGAHIDVTVEFDPQMPGIWFDTLRITSNDVDEGVLEFEIAGRGGAANVHATMEAKGWFGYVPLGSYQTLEMQIINQGTCDLTVTDLMQAFGSTEFTIGEIIGHPAFPVVIFPGEAISVMMKYEPDDYGADAATFIIVSDDAITPAIHVEMNGECNEPNISVSGSLDFGEVCVDSFIDLEFNICNTGVSDLEVTSVTLGAPCDDFIIINNPFPATVSHDFCLPVTVRFAPTTVGDHVCSLEIVSNDPDSPLVSVPITGTSPPPIINITGSLDFGEVCPGELVEKELDICNTGLCDLEVTSVAFNPPCDDFTIINNPFPADVSHDFCLPVTIRYTPTGVGYHECTLEILSNDPVNPIVQVTVTGTTLPILIDVAPDVAFEPTVIQDVYACSTEKPFSVTNVGECPMTVTAFEIVQPGIDYSVIQLPALPATLMPGEELGEGDLRLVFAPYVVMRHSGAEVRVTYVTNDPAIGDTETVTRNLCGEATRTGVRVLVTHLDVPVANVTHLNFYRVYYAGTTEEELAIITLEHDMPLLNVAANPPCEGFEYHREWGALDDPMVLDPGTYQITAKIDDNGQTKTEIWQFVLESCTFFHDLRMEINY